MLLDGECQQIEEQVFGSKQTSFGEQTNSPLSTSLFFPLMSPSLAPSLAYLEQVINALAAGLGSRVATGTQTALSLPLSLSLFPSPSLPSFPSLAYLEQRSVSLEPCRAQRGYGTKTAPEVDA